MAPPTFIQTPAEEYDFIEYADISCEGGTAGNTVAGRLAEVPGVSVLVIEAGKSSYGVKAISTPALATSLVESEYDWQYQATLVDRPDFKRVENAVTRGKVLGGSSSLNYYSWHRGTAAQYNEWELYGGKTWNWEACKPYFSKSTTINTSSKPSLLPITLTNVGSNGPIKLRIVDPAPLGDAVVKAWVSKGYPLANDIFNGFAIGLTHLVASVDDGVRWSSVSFLEDKPSISVLTETKVSKIILEDHASSESGNKYKATGVEIVGGRIIKAKKEVIVSGGVFESPHLLMLSGIGPKEELEKHSIECKVDSPHVGKNLQEHVIMPQVFRLKEGCSLDTWYRPGPQLDSANRQYDEFKSGPLASPILEFSGYMRIDERLALCPAYVLAKEKNGGKDPLGPNGTPHFEFDFVPCFFKSFQPHVPVPTAGDFMTIVTSFMRPISRGQVTLRSNNPTVQPEINLNFFGEEADLEAMREAARFVRDILTTGDSLKDLVVGPYPDDLADLDGDNQAANNLVLRRCSTGYHPNGTCRIGQESGEYAGVLDENMKVRGVANLRVIDASSIPLMPDCRIQAGVYMLGEKGADIIKQAWGY